MMATFSATEPCKDNVQCFEIIKCETVCCMQSIAGVDTSHPDGCAHTNITPPLAIIRGTVHCSVRPWTIYTDHITLCSMCTCVYQGDNLWSMLHIQNIHDCHPTLSYTALRRGFTKKSIHRGSSLSLQDFIHFQSICCL